MSLVARIEALAQRIAQQFNALPQPKVYFWAEENGNLNNNAYQWSFGNGAARSTNYLVLMSNGLITQISLNVDRAPSSTCSVEARVNGQSAAVVTLQAGRTSDVDYASTPFAVKRGDRLQFRTVVAGGAQRGTVMVEITQE